MTNFYEILEVSKNASKEVIDKAYHVLVKKYHPDLQTDSTQQKVNEDKIKQINEAYEVLGNEQKRKIYDLKLEQEIEENERRKKQEQLEELKKLGKINENRRLENNQNNQTDTNVSTIPKNVIDSYRQAYNNYWNKQKIRKNQPWTKKRLLDLLKVVVVFITISLILWFFPPTHKLLVDFYEDNFIVKSAVDVIGQIFIGLWNGLVSIFGNIVNGG